MSTLVACVLARVDTGHAYEVKEALEKLEEVEMVSPITGPYDLLIWVNGESPQHLGQTIVQRIQKTAHVKESITLLLLDEFQRPEAVRSRLGQPAGSAPEQR